MALAGGQLHLLINTVCVINQDQRCVILMLLACRLPTSSSNTDCIPGSIIDLMSSTPLSSELVKKHTQRDPVLSRVCQFVLKG